MEPNYDIDDALWECIKVFGETVDEVDINRLQAFIHKMVPTESDRAILDRIGDVRKYRKILAELKAIPLIAQRTPEWYELRKHRLTASDTAQAMGVGKFGTREQLITKKATGESGGFNIFSPPLKWGTMFEAMASRCYAQRHGDIEIFEFGLLPHPTLQCYGASPDGITELGIMIEIKCPYKRKITGEVPSYYELQMQGQLAVCGLQECDFVECDMQEYSDMTDYFVAIDSHILTDHGVIAEFRSVDGTSITYEYSDPYLSPEEAYRNAEKKASQVLRQDPARNLYKLRPWSLRFMSVRRVKFDNDRWTNLIAPAIQAFWDAVEKRRQQPISTISPSKKPTELDIRSSPSKKQTVEFIDDDD